MRIGIFTGDVGTGDVDGYVDAAGTRRDEGFASYWVSQIFSHDALTLLAVIGREVPDIELGTAVVPTYPRHPMVLAGQALTTNAAASGRLVLGIGLSHQIVIEGMWGYSFDKPARHMREYLTRAHALDPRRGDLRRRPDAHRPGPGDGAGLVADAGRAGRARAADARARGLGGRRHAHVVHRSRHAREPRDPVDQRSRRQGRA